MLPPPTIIMEDAGRMDANQEEAQRAKELGKQYLSNQQYEKAIKFLSISNRLNPNPDTRQLISSAEAGAARLRGTSRRRSTNSTHNASTSPAGGDHQQRPQRTGHQQTQQTPSQGAPNGSFDFSTVQQWFENFVVRSGLQSVLDRIGAHLHPDYRRPLAYMALAILFLGTWRVLVSPRLNPGGAPLLWAGLPGDIHYSTPGFSFSFPIVSSILFSFVANQFFRALQGRRFGG